VLAVLAERGLTRVLVEGGGRTVSSFVAARVLDRLQFAVAPLLIGSGRPALSLPVVETLDAALRPPYRRFDLGPDTLFDFDLRVDATA
jgi:riboflavin biosynthesis pyrimidine reductase